MIADLLDRMIETDMLASAKRTVDTQRYTIMRCQKKYGDSIDENDIHLFLIGASVQTLTQEQRDFVGACKAEMLGVYRAILFQLMEYGELIRLGLVNDYDECRKLLTPNLPFLTAFERGKEKAG